MASPFFNTVWMVLLFTFKIDNKVQAMYNFMYHNLNWLCVWCRCRPTTGGWSAWHNPLWSCLFCCFDVATIRRCLQTRSQNKSRYLSLPVCLNPGVWTPTVSPQWHMLYQSNTTDNMANLFSDWVPTPVAKAALCVQRPQRCLPAVAEGLSVQV